VWWVLSPSKSSGSSRRVKQEKRTGKKKEETPEQAPYLRATERDLVSLILFLVDFSLPSSSEPSISEDVT
jgi:hypothetical protein